jgi:protein gp37
MQGNKKGIQHDYTDYSFGIAQGCCKFSEGCENCYAEEDVLLKYHTTVNGLHVWGPAPQTPRKANNSASHWREPAKWEKAALDWNPAEHEGKAHPIVFCSPLCDMFEDHPTIDAQRAKLWPVIEATPNLNWNLVTKRCANIEKNLPWSKTEKPWPNVWVGVTMENNHRAEERLPVLASLNVVVRHAQMEPLLEPVPSLADYIDQLDWVLVGGESCGSNFAKARILQPAWVRQIKDICDAASVPFFFKQWGSHRPMMKNGNLAFVPMHRFKAGFEINGIIFHAWPTPKTGAPR